MGTVASRNTSINKMSRKDVATLVASLGRGDDFQAYASSAAENGIDGELLASLESPEDLEEILDELEIDNSQHRARLMNAFEEHVLHKSKDQKSQKNDLEDEESRTSVLSATLDGFAEFQAMMDSQAKESENLRNKMDELRGSNHELNGSNHDRKTNIRPLPLDRAAIVLTDVQGSTNLWEADPSAMRKATIVHDKIIRRCCAEYQGYEFNTEGDGFFLAFSTAHHAVGFSLAFQQALRLAEWSNDILSLPWAAPSQENDRRGLRVRISIHMGQVQAFDNPVTGQRDYSGPALKIAKIVERMAAGGQILTTLETWKEAKNQDAALVQSSQVGSVVGSVTTNDVDNVDEPIIEIAPQCLTLLSGKSQ